MNVDEVLRIVNVVVWALVAFVLFKTIRAAREGIRYALKLVLWGAFGVVVTHFFILASGRPDLDLLSWFGAGLGLFMVRPRSRYIPARVKRHVIDRHLKDGGPYDSTKHEIDHIWSFSRGGSNTADNLRVISRAENRRKGAKKPRLRDWF